ncbi:MAG: PilT protein domain protein [Verrucomicrobiales bacterium]|nr:PilT protein domain protein [Verrucomicrobiales bacterium]
MILDTNALSGWAENDRRLLKALPFDRPLYLPAIVLGEYRFGLKSSREGEIRERWLEQVCAALTVLNVDTDTARHYADIRDELRIAAKPIPENDIWISALTRQHTLRLVSRDAHFDFVTGIQRVNW